MQKTIILRGFDEETHLRLKVLAASKGVRMARVVEDLVNEAFEHDKTVVTPKAARGIRRMVKRWIAA